MIEGELLQVDQWLILGTVAALSGLASWITIALMLRFDYAGPIDQPNHRSLHNIAVPRCGGLGILAGIVIGFLAVKPPPVLMLALAGLAAVSLLDDFRSLPARNRLLVQVLGSALISWTWLPPGSDLVGYVLSVLCIVWMTNLFNFMDGANGLAGGMAAIGFAAYALAASHAGQLDLAIWSAGIAAAAVGFLFFNFDPARIFMGDVGSVPLGFLAAVLGLRGFWSGAWPAWFPLVVFSVFTVDATVTILRRGLRGETIWIAHRQHYYQRLIQSGWGHRRLALTAYLLMLTTAGGSCLLIDAPHSVKILMLVALVCAYALVMTWIDRRAPVAKSAQ